jgi:N-acetylmuramoyl-L-alanine amidase
MPVYPGNFKNLGQTKNNDGKFAKGEPRWIVVHYTAGSSNAAAYLFGPHKPASSAHFVITRKGEVYQLSDTDRITWHAGRSEWRGVKMLNSHAIGIELENWGWQDGKRKGLPDSSAWPKLKHKNWGQPAMRWEPYPQAQLAALKKLVLWLEEQYPTIHELVGHDDIAPGRKQDPGPAFPMEEFRPLVT